jgi:hypothetical protein
MREGRAPSCSEPEGEDELLVPGVAGEHFAVEVFSRVSHRWTAAMLAINPAIGGAHDISPRREDMDAESAVSALHGNAPRGQAAIGGRWRSCTGSLAAISSSVRSSRSFSCRSFHLI